MRSDALGLFWQDMPKIKKVKDVIDYKLPEPTWTYPTYLPYFKEAVEFNVPLMTDEELVFAVTNKHEFMYDIESYINYFLVAFKDTVTNKIIYFEKIIDSQKGEVWNDSVEKLLWIVSNTIITGFYSNGYDKYLLLAALAGLSVNELKGITNSLIVEGVRPNHIVKKLGLNNSLFYDHRDIIEVVPLNGSLKIYGGRCGTKKMQDLPYNPDVYLTPDQITVTRFYCINDLDTTHDVYNNISQSLSLRKVLSEKYALDLMSKSDAQIAEAVIKNEIENQTNRHVRRPRIDPGSTFSYDKPNWLSFQTTLMNSVLDVITNSLFIIEENGRVNIPQTIHNIKFTIGKGVYKIGIGGLHSNEKQACHIASGNTIIKEKDVTSYYPFIIMNNKYFPQHLGEIFLKVYSNIVYTRLDAKDRVPLLENKMQMAASNELSLLKMQLKQSANDAQSLKIVINGAFGKLGSPYSIMYSPKLLIQTTITGQLALLMLIETLELNNMSVISANTDGIVVKMQKEQEALFEHICKQWEDLTKFNLDGGSYKIYASASVNAYFAVTPEGKVKTKGLYAKPGLSNNPSTPICSSAVGEFLSKGTPFEDTIKACKDPFMFSSVRGVTGGAVAVEYHDFGESHDAAIGDMEGHCINTGWKQEPDGMWSKGDVTTTLRKAYASARTEPVHYQYLGKAIRWYYAKPQENKSWLILTAKRGSRVPKSQDARPMMEMPDTLPEDLDYDWYVKECENILIDIGYTPKPAKK